MTKKGPVFWVSLNYYYGLGFWELQKRGFLDNYHLICADYDPVIPLLRKQGLSIFCLAEKQKRALSLYRNTGHLLAHLQVQQWIKERSGSLAAQIAFFKPSSKIDHIIDQNGYVRIGNSANISRPWENKFEFYRFCHENDFPVPPGELTTLTKQGFSRFAKKYGLPFVVQTANSWAGKGSFLITTEKDFCRLFKRQGSIVKISSFIRGETLINNACVTETGKILVSPPARQITGVPLLTPNPLSTCGREWTKNVAPDLAKKISLFTQKLGRFLFQKGYRGFFGLDFLISGSGQVFLLECNPRLTASFVFYNYLETEQRIKPLLWYHFLSFSGGNKGTNLSREELRLQGGEVNQRNVSGKTLKVSKVGFTSGSYSLPKDERKDTFFPKDKDEYTIFFPTAGKAIAPNDEVIRLGTRAEIATGGKIKPQVIDALSWSLKKVSFT